MLWIMVTSSALLRRAKARKSGAAFVEGAPANRTQSTIASVPMAQPNHALPTGYQLDAYRIERQISVGGFSIVYIAVDEDGEQVIIKEYLPASLALREEGDILPTVKAEHLTMFRYGMKCFFEEGRALAGLQHPNVVRVLNFFRANDTVYMVMQYERGVTLQDYVRRHKGQISERFVRGVFTRLLNGLREVHSHKLLHLDIKPSNIYLRLDGTPVLLDFGAARQTLASSAATMLKPMYTPGFAAPEQYTNRDLLGPWSDIYSIGASMYSCLSGTSPQAADTRLEKDEVAPAVRRFFGRCSPQLLETIDWCMKLDYLERPQSVFALQKALSRRDHLNHRIRTLVEK
jgi:serine/threonine protein kinase